MQKDPSGYRVELDCGGAGMETGQLGGYWKIQMRDARGSNQVEIHEQDLW